tara:strand:- start:272 stop:739 length:468 start_codon:yes stop_codon:yes gene_type:complete
MALFDLTGQNIQDTYHRLLQLSSSGEVVNGTGSLAAITNITVSETGSFGRVMCTSISASTGDFDANTIRIGGTSFSKSDLDSLKSGASIRTNTSTIGGEITKDYFKAKAFVSPASDNTYIKLGTDIVHVAGNITSSGNISASGDIYFNNMSGGTF